MLDQPNNAQTIAPSADEEAQGLDLYAIINFLWRRWKLILGVAALAMLIAFVHLARVTPLYAANVQILLEPPKARVLGQNQVISDPALDAVAFEGQLSIIRSTVLLRRVVDKEKLLGDPEFGSAPATATGGWQPVSAIKFFFSKQPPPGSSAEPANSTPDENPIGVIPANVLAVIGNLQGALEVKRAPGQANLINIGFTSTNPARSARLANAIGDAYVVDGLDARYEAALRASNWLNDRVVELRQQLRDSEQAVAEFRAQNNLPASTSGATLSQEQLAQLNGRLVAARTEVAERKAQLDMLRMAEGRGGNLAGLSEVTSIGAVADLRKQLAELSRQEADLSTHYSDKYPALVNIHAQMQDVRRQIGVEIQRAATKISEDYQLAKAREDALVKALREATGQTGLDAAKTITLRELERTAAVNKSLFEDFLQRSRITQEQSTFEPRDSRIITPALPPGGPSFPKKSQVLLIALVLGLAAGGGGAYVIELLNRGFTTPSEVESMLQAPVLASISHMRDTDLTFDGEIATMPMMPFIKPMSRFSESIRALRSGVQMADVDNPPKVLQFTSTLPAEGKTTIALSLAASAAQSGLKVLFIDCDLRQPSATRFFGLEKEKGLVDYLIDAVKLEEIVHFQETTRFWMLPSGAKTQNPSDLLGSERLKKLVERFRDKFDLVVIDTPPLGPVIDPLVVAQHVADKVIYVVRWSSTPREMVQRSMRQLSGHGGLAGVVFNHVNDRQAQKYGKYGYSYYYGGGRYYRKYYGS